MFSSKNLKFLLPFILIVVFNYIVTGFLSKYIEKRYGIEKKELKEVKKVTKGSGVFFKKPTLSDYLDPILKRNIFDSSSVWTPEKEHKDEEKDDSLEGMEKSDLNLELVGTIVARNPLLSIGIVRDRGAKEALLSGYRVGDDIQGREVFEIDRLRMILKREDGTFEYLEIEKKGTLSKKEDMKEEEAYEPYSGIKKVSDDKYLVSEKDIEYAMANLSKISTEARVVPHFEGGKSVGFKIFAIKGNSFFKKAGFKNGDIVERINGYEINSPEKALQIYEELKNEKHITVDLTRGGRKMSIEYDIR